MLKFKKKKKKNSNTSIYKFYYINKIYSISSINWETREFACLID